MEGRGIEPDYNVQKSGYCSVCESKDKLLNIAKYSPFITCHNLSEIKMVLKSILKRPRDVTNYVYLELRLQTKQLVYK